jgi:hypothetical protein
MKRKAMASKQQKRDGDRHCNHETKLRYSSRTTLRFNARHASDCGK